MQDQQRSAPAAAALEENTAARNALTRAIQELTALLHNDNTQEDDNE